MNKMAFNADLSRKDLETILDNLPRLVMLIDQDGTILYWNGGGEKVFGYKAEEVEGKPVWSLYPDRGSDEFEEELALLKKGKSISFEVEGHHKNNSSIWLDVKRVMIENSQGESIILGTASDISTQKKVEFELSESQARTEAILETAVEGIITIDKKGTIQGFNKAAEEMFGYSAEEVMGENVNILMPSPYNEEHDQYIENYLETGEKKIIGIGREVRGKRKDGSIFPIELAVNEVRFGDEVIFTGLIKDISNRRQLENEILKIAEEERINLGQELHDSLGQMLSGIGMISRNLARKFKANGLPAADEIVEIADMIKEADEQARQLAHGLAHIELENEGLEVAIHRLCERLQSYYGIQCTCELSDLLENETKSVSLHLYRIVQEALNNAINHGKADHISVSFEANENHLQLIVEDDGIGFSKSESIENEKGMGIKTMRYRAHTLGGNLRINRTSDGWTQVVCRIPLNNLQQEQITK
ncbi:PAS domain-containing sensor histidine kinase [Fodinibius sp. AD559]|uniref:PAS domain-containing sensor histidine kinase n=1 Tax=Fodinibius sp. AD559 TaxID=3424179 RepID=UPI004046F1A7